MTGKSLQDKLFKIDNNTKTFKSLKHLFANLDNTIWKIRAIKNPQDTNQSLLCVTSAINCLCRNNRKNPTLCKLKNQDFEINLLKIYRIGMCKIRVLKNQIGHKTELSFMLLG